ncbi:MAG: DNA mismatch repair protein MutS [Vallitalea sp.]|jgi:DNA mismatch repair protein MutS|nr:DNA mismatch repair protein MutS [Vallitalea sp.]
MKNKLSPMMQQYMDLKDQYKDCILFFRLGDFYEMFFDDAKLASRELGITLTGRDCGQAERAPMCGVPHHSAENYINKLIKKGYKVAICEQVEDPKLVKGIVKRDVIRIVTPGTNLNMQSLDESKNNYLMSIYQDKHKYGISLVDITTGDFLVTEVDSERKLIDEIGKFVPTEIICNENITENNDLMEMIKNRFHSYVSEQEEWYFDYSRCVGKIKEQFAVATIDGLGIKGFNEGICAVGALLEYLFTTQKNNISHITKITPYLSEAYMMVDLSSKRNLELVETLREKERKGSLLWVLDKTKTAMGSRLLRKWIEQPLLLKDDIENRLDGIQELKDKPIIAEELKEFLNPIYDLERLMSKISLKTANCRDLTAFKTSLEMLPFIKKLLSECSCNYITNIKEDFDDLRDIFDLIERGIIDDPPISIKDGGIIKTGYHQQVDKLREAGTRGKQWIAELEAKEKELTGIKNLKIKFNKVFGYYIEITKSNLDLVPDRYIRKQTLANSERYITPELKEMENTILGAEEKIIALEYELFVELRNKIAIEVERIKETAKNVATLDVISSLAEVATRYNYVRPILNNEGIIDIKDGRHPVVEKMMNNGMFISNDTYLDKEESRFSIITGPNMAGKSTYMRQVALIVLMAQIGSFVPASDANIGIVDRIFTRVGASDDLASGQSTFMVEMTEVANILRNSTNNSLLILDEIGRGTSTFDGLSIAWAVVEYIVNKNKIGAKTLFATHYHELTELEGKVSGVQNYCVSVKENGDDIIFLRKIIKGSTDNSYGIQVAKLAGVPSGVIDRAKILLNKLSDADITKNAEKIVDTDVSLEIAATKDKKVENENINKNNKNIKDIKTEQVQCKEEDVVQLGLFDFESNNELIDELKNLNIVEMTPMDALNKLYELHKKSLQ